MSGTLGSIIDEGGAVIRKRIASVNLSEGHKNFGEFFPTSAEMHPRFGLWQFNIK